ncbi:40S ribosomal protein S27-like protein [Myotis davidii]|uniref:40S ribosomal protein S27-like protein n=1 Tax=Myotis davidii TaxID=225400 RepID=L5LUZ1_MYODS|nr:40S ribosomal protein S27-like protein [Myotis davidii]
MPLAEALLPPSAEGKRRHKKKCLEQSPSSHFMDVKGPGCCKIITAFGHAQAVGLCVGSVSLQEGEQGSVSLQGGSFRRKQHLQLLDEDEQGIIPINTLLIKK